MFALLFTGNLGIAAVLGSVGQGSNTGNLCDSVTDNLVKMHMHAYFVTEYLIKETLII